MPEILVIAVIVMIIFGPTQLPRLGRSIGETIREMRGVGKELRSLHEDDEPEPRV